MQLRNWFTLDAPLNRRRYITAGLLLAAIKILGDYAILWVISGTVWNPLDYGQMLMQLYPYQFGLSPINQSHPAKLLLAAWLIPFFAAALVLSMRRARDAGGEGWMGLWIMLPYINYAVILYLSLAPTRWREARPPIHEYDDRRRRTAVLSSILIGSAFALLLLTVSVSVFRAYAGTLLVCGPTALGALVAYALNRQYDASPRETAVTVMAALLTATAGIILLAIEGLICLLMLSPLAVIMALVGGMVGRSIARAGGGSLVRAAFGMGIFPLATGFPAPGAAPIVHEVRSAIEVDAPPDVVWRNVIAFPPMAPPAEWYFRAGLAYPVGATIDGDGVGAVRRCEFSTGAFVEPITAWEPDRRLAFDVVENPAPLRELSPYAEVTPPHLEGFFAARRGEFRIVELPGRRTRLEGSTWYVLRLAPDPYWSWWTDRIVERIHGRVLDHIRIQSERRPAG